MRSAPANSPNSRLEFPARLGKVAAHWAGMTVPVAMGLVAGACCSLPLPKLAPVPSVGGYERTTTWQAYAKDANETLYLGLSGLQVLPSQEVSWMGFYRRTNPATTVAYAFRWHQGGSLERAEVPMGLPILRARMSDRAVLPDLWTYSSGNRLDVMQSPDPGLGGHTSWSMASMAPWILLAQQGSGAPAGPPRIVRSLDGGATWRVVFVGQDIPKLPLPFTLESNGSRVAAFRSYYAGNGLPPVTELTSSVDGGASWTGTKTIPAVYDFPLFSVSLTSAGDYLAGCDYWTTLPRSVITFDLAGNLYHRYSHPNQCTYTAFWNRDVGAVATETQVYWTVDAGGTLQDLHYPLRAGASVSQIKVLSDHELLVVAIGGTPLGANVDILTRDGGGNWSRASIADLQ